MNLKKIILSLIVAAAIIPSMAFAGTTKVGAKTMGHRKGGYVHATTYVTKKGTVVHRKGGYRHAVKGAPKHK